MSLLRHRTPAALLATLLVFGGTAATVVATEAPAVAAPGGTQTFDVTGAAQTFTVPAGITSVTVTARGGAGGSGVVPSGGNGAQAIGTFAVSPGELIQVMVGDAGADTVGGSGIGSGGFNGGADGGSGGPAGGGGGGASDIRTGACAITSSCTLPDRVLVAGGGGGASATQFGGDALNPNGDRGDSGGTATGGEGGTQGGGGAAGTAGGSGGANGTGGVGGAGTIISDAGGGGGGGGFFGGGGGGIDAGDGSAAGGGAGSSNVSLSATGSSITGAVNASAGQVIFDWADTGVPLTSHTLSSDDNPQRYGGDVVLTATLIGATGDGGVPTGTVTFDDSGTALCTAVAVAAPSNTDNTGVATCSVPANGAFGVGSHGVTSTYSGDDNYAAGTDTLTQEVIKSDTTTAVTQTAGTNPSNFGSSVTFQAAVTASEPGAGTPTGTAQFFADSVAIAGCETSALNGSGNATCATAALTGGDRSITAVYSNDGNFNASTSSALSHTVSAIATSTALITSDAGTVAGEPVTFTATVSSATGTPAGTVAFMDGSTAIASCGTQSLTSGVATCNTNAVSVGTRSITAVYAGSANHATSTSSPVTQTVTQASTTTSLVSSDLSTVSGEQVFFTVVVSPVSPSTGVPSGTVSFKRGTTVITDCAGAPLDGTGTVTCGTSSLPVGTFSVTATYSGSPSYDVSTSSAISQVVSKASTSSTLVSSQNPSNDGESVTFTATVATTAPGGGVPVGSVSFFVDGAFASSSALAGGIANYTTSGLAPGEHTVVAFYGGSPSSLSSTSSDLVQVVRTDTTTSVSSSADPSTFGGPVTFTATISPLPDGGTVQFRIDGVDFGTPVTVTGGVAVSNATSALTGGEHAVVANYSGTSTFGSSTDTLSQTVNKATSATAMSSAPDPSSFNQSVTLTATVTSGAGTPTGTVTFFDDTTNLGTGTLSGGVATLATTALTAGSHQLHAVYSTSTNHLASTSPDDNHTVNQATTGTALASSLNPSQFGAPVTFTATVTQTSAGTGTPGGTVDFFDGITQVGSDTLDGSGVATYDVSDLSVASHSITAVYAGNTSYATSTSTPVVQVVNKANTATVITSSEDPSDLGQAVSFTATVSPTPDGGTVQFTVDSVAFGSPVTVTGGVAVSGSTSSLAGGTHTVDAVYSGNASYNPSTATQFTQDVGVEASTTTLTSNHNPSVSGQSVTVTATVTSDVGTPGGNVTFMDGSTTLGTVALTAGSATFTTSAFTVGTHPLTANYAGSVSYVSSTDDLSQVVEQSASTTALVSDNNPSARGDTVVFTATVSATAPGSGTPTGTISFTRDGSVVSTPTLTGGVATYSTASFTGGTHAISVAYSGDTNFAISSTPDLIQTVNATATTTGMVSSDTTTVRGESVTFTATVSSLVGVPTGTVSFQDNGLTMGTGTVDGSGAATFTTTDLSVGTHPIVAVYTGNSDFVTSSSSTVSQIVAKAATTTGLVSSDTSTVSGESVTFTATVAATAPGTGTPSGTVTFKNGAATMGTGTLNEGGVATFSTSALSVATHSITAVYETSAGYLASTSNTVGQVVAIATAAVVLTSDDNPSESGDSVTFTATVNAVAPGTGTPTGSLAFFVDGAQVSTGSLSAGAASFSTSSLAQGSHDVVAFYSGSPTFNSGTSNTIAQMVRFATTTDLTADANPSVFGQPVTFTATVSSTGGTPTGSVTFRDGEITIGTASLTGGVASVATSTLGIGTHGITASYEGDGSFSTSDDEFSQVVTQAATTTAVTGSPNPSLFGQLVSLTATVSTTAPGAGTPGGTVQFFDGETVLGTGTLSGGVATFSTSTLTTGTHSITGVYSASVNFLSSTSGVHSQTVNQATTTSTATSAPNPSKFGEPVTVTATIAATAPGAGTPTGTVTFMDSSTSLGTGTLSGGIATLTTSSLAVATHSLTAVYAGDTNFTTSTSSSTSQVVEQAGTSATLTSTTNPSVNGQSVTFTGTISANAPGAGTPTGSVTFEDDGNVIATVTLVAGVATFSTSSLTPGSHPMAVRYNGDTNFGSTSQGLTQFVGLAATSTTVSATPNPSTFGQSVTITANVSVTSPGAGTLGGTVTFIDGATSLGTGSVNSSGVATLSTSSLSAATHSIAAVYGGSATLAASTSSAVAQVVNKASTTTTVASTPNPSVFGESVAITVTVVANAPGAGTPDGIVSVTRGGTLLWNAALDGAGQRTLSGTSLAVGSGDIVATFTGSESYAFSTSSALTHVVNQAATSTTVVSSPNPSVSGQTVTLTATTTATAPGGGTPTGAVQFMDGATPIGAPAFLQGGQASGPFGNLPAGTHSITAVYAGTANYNTSTSSAISQVVNPAATTTVLTSDHNPSAVGQLVTFSATVAATAPGAGLHDGTVTFKDGATTLSTQPLHTNVATYSTDDLTLATHAITAVYTGDANYLTSTSSSLSQIVNQAATTSVVSSNHSPSVFGQSVTITATVAGTGGGTPGGSVTFKDGVDIVGTDTLGVDGTATYTTSDLTVAMHTITAVYAGNADYAASTSPDFDQRMNKAATATTLRSSGSPSRRGDSVTFTARARSLAPGAGVPTGTMAFFRVLPDNTRRWIANVTLVNGVATITMDNLPVGTTRISSVYRGSDDHLTSETARNERVNP